MCITFYESPYTSSGKHTNYIILLYWHCSIIYEKYYTDVILKTIEIGLDGRQPVSIPKEYVLVDFNNEFKKHFCKIMLALSLWLSRLLMPLEYKLKCRTTALVNLSVHFLVYSVVKIAIGCQLWVVNYRFSVMVGVRSRIFWDILSYS